MIGHSKAFLAVLNIIKRIAVCDAPVLIEGETGTGKELAARAIHYDGCRRNRAFVPLNCGAVPEHLLVNELFGHAKGAFTGADGPSPGVIGLAHAGTLFLDEIDSLPMNGQVSLLRFLQDGRYRPLGASREESADVRVIAASNRDLQKLAAAGKFREDLLFRLRVLSVMMPPLRDREGDVELLTDYFLAECARKYGSDRRRVSVETRAFLNEYPWPGNVRELENLLHREYLMADDAEIRLQALRSTDGERTPSETSPPLDRVRKPYAAARDEAMAAFDRAYLGDLLRATRGNVSQAARVAGKERRALGKLLKKYKLGQVPLTQR